MPIESARIFNDIETIAGFSETTPDLGCSRPTFSPPWRAARDYVISKAEAAGCKVRIDAAGNVYARHASIGWDEKVWLSGSHIDSVPTGGKFDGVMGIVCPLEVLRSGILPLELVIWAEEEGTTFGLGMIGSRLATGAETTASIAPFKNRDGKTFVEAGEPHGVRTNDIPSDRLRFDGYHGLIEIHAEQGPAMWETGAAVAVVTAIAGRRQYKGKFMGTPNHAGSTPMRYRADPLVALARVITGVDAIARNSGPSTVATVGRVECLPNAVNVIPGTVRFTIDLRSSDSVTLAACNEEIEQLVISSGASAFNFTCTENQPPVPMDQHLCKLLVNAGDGMGQTTSGALHDAAILAPHLPTAMLFVASKDGISHNPAEFSRIEDIAAAARVLEKLVTGS
jgi:hydantoinase/carbamoylase family amidase